MAGDARHSALKVAAVIACLGPLAQLVWLAATDGLGANPIEAALRHLGTWTLNFLLLTLAATPLHRYFRWLWPMRLRRMLGLYAFFYATLHVLAYVGLDQYFDWNGILRDLAKRPFITVGSMAFVLLIPLAATSSAAMVRRLGGRAWMRLHRSVYLIAVLGVAHYGWLVKQDITLPLLYGLALGILLGLRALHPRRGALLRTGQVSDAAT